jgi:hypothetical protein
MHDSTRRLLSGSIGAAALTAIHQIGRFVRPDVAPRMDVVGMRALARGYRMAGVAPPNEQALYYQTLAGDLVANAAYYSAVPGRSGATTLRRAAMLGLAAGVGAYLLPSRLSLGDPPNSDRVANAVMTVSWYVAGALATAACAEVLRPRPAAAYFSARRDAFHRHQAERR